MKIRISALDKKFSHWIRWVRAKGKCERCSKQYQAPSMALHCSHFHGRAKKSVRYDPSNCQALCYGCHVYLGSRPVEHYDFMLKKLGQKQFDLLSIRANTHGMPDLKLISLWLDTESKIESSRILGRKA